MRLRAVVYHDACHMKMLLNKTVNIKDNKMTAIYFDMIT